MLTISFCTTVHNRLHQFQAQYAQNREVILNTGGVEWVILNYNSSDGLHEFMESQGQLPQKIKYVECLDGAAWHLSVAKNLAHKEGTGDILMNLDCDNLIDDAVQVIRDHFENRIDVLHLWSGTERDGTYGRVAIWSKLFHNIGGYDESFEPMGYQDKDLMHRALHYGAVTGACLCRPGIALINTKVDSISHCNSTKTWLQMRAANAKRSQENLKAGKLIANCNKEDHG